MAIINWDTQHFQTKPLIVTAGSLGLEPPQLGTYETRATHSEDTGRSLLGASHVSWGKKSVRNWVKIMSDYCDGHYIYIYNKPLYRDIY